jgi:hypothetical protein
LKNILLFDFVLAQFIISQYLRKTLSVSKVIGVSLITVAAIALMTAWGSQCGFSESSKIVITTLVQDSKEYNKTIS